MSGPVVLENHEGERKPVWLPDDRGSIFVAILRPIDFDLPFDAVPPIKHIEFRRTDEAIELDSLCCTIYRQV